MLDVYARCLLAYLLLIYGLIYDTSELSPECQIQSPMVQWRSHRFHHVFKFKGKENTFLNLKNIYQISCSKTSARGK